MKKLFGLILLICCLALPALSGCKDPLNVDPVGPVAVERVTLDKTSLDLKIGESFRLHAEVAPENAENKAVKWSSSDDKIASVSDDGTVTGLAGGNATVSVTTEDGNKRAECKVVVAPNTIYEDLAEYAKKESDRSVVTVTTERDGETLTDRYELKRGENGGYTVEFTLERLSTFEEKNGEIVLPESDRKTLRGKIMFGADGDVTGREGEEIDLPVKSLSPRGFDFREENFSDPVFEEGSFRAKVKNAAAFLNAAELKAEDMTVEASVEAERIKQLSVSYSIDGNHVTIVYEFSND